MVEAFGPVKRNPRRRRPSLRVAPEVTDPSNIVQTFWKHSKVGRSWRSLWACPADGEKKKHREAIAWRRMG